MRFCLILILQKIQLRHSKVLHRALERPPQQQLRVLLNIPASRVSQRERLRPAARRLPTTDRAFCLAAAKCASKPWYASQYCPPPHKSTSFESGLVTFQTQQTRQTAHTLNTTGS